MATFFSNLLSGMKNNEILKIFTMRVIVHLRNKYPIYSHWRICHVYNTSACGLPIFFCGLFSVFHDDLVHIHTAFIKYQ